MCGIGGIVTTTPLPASAITGIHDALLRRGPDEGGYSHTPVRGTPTIAAGWPGPEEWTGIGLTHRRLSILDLDAGAQPMARDALLAFNGEVYGFKDLRARLPGRFATGTDTEVVLAAYETWGLEAFSTFDGMYAMAIQDDGVLLARDPVGIKPLYVSQGPGAVAFASTPTALLHLPWVRPVGDRHRLRAFLTHGADWPNDRSWFRDIRQLPPGHVVRITGDARIEPVMQIPLPPLVRRSMPDPVGRLRDGLLESVRLHLQSDVKVGLSLSGGLDSSSLAGAMHQLDQPVRSFTYRSDDVPEADWAQMVVDHVGAKATWIDITSDELVRDLPDLVQAQGEPFGSTSIYAQHRVHQAARSAGVKVMLDGQGGDELLGGYGLFIGSAIHQKAARLHLVDAVRLARRSRAYGIAPHLAVGRALRIAVPRPLARGLGRIGVLERHQRPDWMVGLDDVPMVDFLPNAGRSSFRHDLRRSLLQAPMPAILRYADRNSMHHGVEARVPFLHRKVMDVAASISAGRLLGDGRMKPVLRQAARPWLPETIVRRPDKIGFETDERRWLSEQRDHFAPLLAAAADLPFVDKGRLQRRIESYHAGAKWPIWRLLSVTAWMQRFDITFEQP